jgi:hypothetical protein
MIEIFWACFFVGALLALVTALEKGDNNDADKY